MLIASVDLKKMAPFGSDLALFEIAVLTLCWSRSVPGLGESGDTYSDDAVSFWLNQWFDENRDNLPGTMDAELIESLWFDHEKR
jgi:hypothetical protein